MEQLKHVTMVEAEKKVPVIHEFDDLVTPFSSSSFETGNSSGLSLESDSFEEVASPASSSSSSSSSSIDPLNDMSALFQQLPIKRGLSKYYQGKAQSFTSLGKVRSLEDLAKPEKPYNKKLKSCRSYGEGLMMGANCNNPNSAISPRHNSSSTSSRSGSCHSLISAKRGSDNNNKFMGKRPPIPPHRSTSSNTIPNQTVLLV